MTNPITDLLALRRLPGALAADLGVITHAMRSVSAIEYDAGLAAHRAGPAPDRC